jgi:hypothetical protein
MGGGVQEESSTGAAESVIDGFSTSIDPSKSNPKPTALNKSKAIPINILGQGPTKALTWQVGSVIQWRSYGSHLSSKVP